MRHNVPITGIVAAAISVGTAGVASAAGSPEIRISFDGPDNIRTDWNVNGHVNCNLIGKIGSGDIAAAIPTDTGHEIITGAKSSYFRIECPDGTKSPTYRIYGPRNPLNDLRTQFANSTQGMFGS
ncbi:hypothetical protein nbrc107696_23620 [Gordonia spumicola]|uniref:Secreted protein n=1 Tax=Gordonia spumicola TaxID=589161 RepID=A0A7I9V937_9ACTN|nr:hypothetical protein [Gordonia spumicola]GEE01916.1 hypothetical protein nbrc107696_23620 [Gordonia spumicola]